MPRNAARATTVQRSATSHRVPSLKFRRLLGLSTVVASTILVGCASGYHKFYQPANGATPEAIARLRAAPAPANPIVERAAPPSDSKALADSFRKRGYELIGTSFFNSGRAENENAAVQKGKEVGADLVLILNPKYTGSTTSSVPLTLPTSTTSYSSGTATAYGAGGSVTAYGSGTTTTYGSQTTYIPVTTHRSDYGAVFFVKQRMKLGVKYRELTDSERQELQTNQAVAIDLVVDNTPAFYADILPGDIILAVDGVNVAGRSGLSSALDARSGQKITLTIVRRGQRIEKTLQLGA